MKWSGVSVFICVCVCCGMTGGGGGEEGVTRTAIIRVFPLIFYQKFSPPLGSASFFCRGMSLLLCAQPQLLCDTLCSGLPDLAREKSNKVTKIK